MATRSTNILGSDESDLAKEYRQAVPLDSVQVIEPITLQINGNPFRQRRYTPDDCHERTRDKSHLQIPNATPEPFVTTSASPQPQMSNV